MLRRIFHSMALFVAIVASYQGYAWCVVPWLEPPIIYKQSQGLPDEAVRIGSPTVTKYQELLASYFPAGHWSLTRPPKVVENAASTVMFVLDDYQRQSDGQVTLSHFALLIFPTPRDKSATPPRDAVILEAPEGAQLQFDENFHPERGQIGQITRGVFPGPITIRSDMKAPGPEDDLIIETRDLEMNTKLLTSSHEVRFRLGPNAGSGRELEIRFLEDDDSSGGGGGMAISGIDSMEVRREVRARFLVGSKSLLPSSDGHDGDKSASGERPARRLPGVSDADGVQLASAEVASRGDVQPPVEVTCSGPFRFDFIRYVASFDQNVDVIQFNPQGASDQLTCDQLDIHFARKAEAEKRNSAIADPGRQQRDDLRWLEPDQIVAQGFPVVIISPSRRAEVRGSRVQLALRQRRITVEGGQEAMVAYGANVLRAPKIQYQHPAADAPTKIGSFRADGPGTLHYLPDEKKPEQVFEAAWQASVELSRYNGQPVLTLAGRPKLAMTAMGQLTADQIRVYLRELEASGGSTPALPFGSQAGVGGKIQVLPDRMNAVGQVEIDSPELLARTREFVATFQAEPAAGSAAAAVVGGSAENGVTSAAGGGGNGVNGAMEPFKMSGRRGAPLHVYQLISDGVELQIALRGPHAVPIAMACNGHVAFRELPAAAGTPPPFEIRGGQLTADSLDTSAHIKISGPSPEVSPEDQLAQILANGMTVRAAAVELDQAQNRLWSDGPGTATMPMTRDLSGRDTGAAYTVQIRWEGGLAFDGRSVVFQRKVLVEGADETLRCDALAGKLSAPINFGERMDRGAIDLAEIECQGNVAIDHTSRDPMGLTSHERVQLNRLTVNQKTGAISGDGPGLIRSTHFASSLGALAGPGALTGASPPTAQPAGGVQLHFLRVDFDGGLVGNMFTREIAFRQRVRTIYGPVDSWEQELDLDHADALPPETLTLTCDELGLNEDPVLAGRKAVSANPGKMPGGENKLAINALQMRAFGNVRIDGQSTTQGTFAATAERAAYEKAKELFILEGTDRTPATLWHQQQGGGQQVQNSARKIQYNHLSGQIEQDGVHALEFMPNGGGAASPQNALAPAARRQ